MFNMDNCFECARQQGHVCAQEDFYEPSLWNCNGPDVPDAEKPPARASAAWTSRSTGWLGMAPPPPGMRLWATDSRLHVFWDDLSLVTEVIRLPKIDFESFRIWRADNRERPYGSSVVDGPESGLWQVIGEYDLVNSYVQRRRDGAVTVLDTIPLGANTGLDPIAYHTRCAWPMTPRDADGTANPAVVAKHATEYFEYVDRGIHNGFICFCTVTATDHALLPDGNPSGIDLPVGPGQSGDPGSSFSDTVPGAEAQTAADRAQFGTNIYVYQNPATRAALREYQELLPNEDDPTGVRVTFTNLPAAHNTIRVYTASGAIIRTIDHSGLDGLVNKAGI